jgi:hypothetical protein
VLTEDSLFVGGAIAVRRKTTPFGDLREIKREFIFAARALDQDVAFAAIPRRIGDAARIEIRTTATKRDSGKLPDTAVFEGKGPYFRRRSLWAFENLARVFGGCR